MALSLLKILNRRLGIMNQLGLSTETLEGISLLANQLDLSINDFFEEIIQRKLTVINAKELEELLDIRDAIIGDFSYQNWSSARHL